MKLIYTMKYYSTIKGKIVPYAEVNGPTDIQSEVYTHTHTHIKSYVWNLEKCYRWTYLQRRNRNIHVEKNVWIPRREGALNELGDCTWHIYTTMYTTDLQLREL